MARECISITFKITDAHAALKQEEPKDAQVVKLEDIDPEETILNIKHQLNEKTDISHNMCRLIFKGKILKDDASLQSSGVVEGSVVHIVKSTPKVADGEYIQTGPGYTHMTKGALEEKLKDPVAMEDMMKHFDKMMRSNHARKDPFGALAKECAGGNGMQDVDDAAAMIDNPKIQEMMQQVMQNPQLMEQMFSHDGEANHSVARMMAKDSFKELQGKMEEKIDNMPGGLDALLNQPSFKQAVKDVKGGSIDNAKAQMDAEAELAKQ